MPRTLLCGKEAGRAMLPGQLIIVKMTPPGGCAKALKQTTKQRKSWVNIGGGELSCSFEKHFSVSCEAGHMLNIRKRKILRDLFNGFASYTEC